MKGMRHVSGATVGQSPLRSIEECRVKSKELVRISLLFQTAWLGESGYSEGVEPASDGFGDDEGVELVGECLGLGFEFAGEGS